MYLEYENKPVNQDVTQDKIDVCQMSEFTKETAKSQIQNTRDACKT